MFCEADDWGRVLLWSIKVQSQVSSTTLNPVSGAIPSLRKTPHATYKQQQKHNAKSREILFNSNKHPDAVGYTFGAMTRILALWDCKPRSGSSFQPIT